MKNWSFAWIALPIETVHPYETRSAISRPAQYDTRRRKGGKSNQEHTLRVVICTHNSTVRRHPDDHGPSRLSSIFRNHALQEFYVKSNAPVSLCVRHTLTWSHERALRTKALFSPLPFLSFPQYFYSDRPIVISTPNWSEIFQRENCVGQ